MFPLEPQAEVEPGSRNRGRRELKRLDDGLTHLIGQTDPLFGVRIACNEGRAEARMAENDDMGQREAEIGPDEPHHLKRSDPAVDGPLGINLAARLEGSLCHHPPPSIVPDPRRSDDRVMSRDAARGSAATPFEPYSVRCRDATSLGHSRRPTAHSDARRS